MSFANELGCVKYIEIGAQSRLGIEENMLDSLYNEYVKNEHEKLVSQLPFETPKKKKKKFFLF